MQVEVNAMKFFIGVLSVFLATLSQPASAFLPEEALIVPGASPLDSDGSPVCTLLPEELTERLLRNIFQAIIGWKSHLAGLLRRFMHTEEGSSE